VFELQKRGQKSLLNHAPAVALKMAALENSSIEKEQKREDEENQNEDEE